ncbi:protein spaetzle-like [Melitaea cinxia]|uniref:protein spaetzle-like n=1 Tax=Melitaea cinxia TaxID=113334 RepID=UPI001E273800|nr:protein spaetzle-like [Melitaea cinxia]
MLLKDKKTLIADDPIIPTTQKPRLLHGEWLHNQRVFGGQHHSHDHHNRVMGGSSSSSERDTEIPLCHSTVLYQRPKVAENRNKLWKFILNDDDQPIQTFRLERCNTSRSTCSEMINFIPTYEGVCVQKWILKEMYYIHDDGTIGNDYFKIPSCCACRLMHRNK